MLFFPSEAVLYYQLSKFNNLVHSGHLTLEFQSLKVTMTLSVDLEIVGVLVDVNNPAKKGSHFISKLSFNIRGHWL